MHLLDTLAIVAGALVFAKLIGGVGERFRIPAVLAELMVGIAIGNMGLELDDSDLLHALSELGVLFLLFLVGLETDIKEVKKVGVDATLAAAAGVIAPFILAFLVIPFFIPDFGVLRTLFVAAALTATSVGITARVLQDTKKLSTISGQIILSAAVIDDVMGIVVLAVVTALVTKGTVVPADIGILLAKIAGFFAAVFLARRFVVRHIFRIIKPIEVSGTVTILLLSLCLIMAWASEQMGLAGIVGAFALGLMLDDVHFKGFKATETFTIETLMKPVTDFLAPIFFIVMGMQVKLPELFRADALVLGSILVLCGIIGKFVCGFVISKKSVKAGADRLLIGFGMIPRGEVGLIFAAMGAKLGLLNDSHYAALILMVVVTTMTAPILISLRATK